MGCDWCWFSFSGVSYPDTVGPKMFMQSSVWITYALVCQGGSTNHIICRGRGVFPQISPTTTTNIYLFQLLEQLQRDIRHSSCFKNLTHRKIKYLQIQINNKERRWYKRCHKAKNRSGKSALTGMRSYYCTWTTLYF